MKIILFLVIFLSSWKIYAQEIRCGWLDNPTPGNNWLIDKDGYWNISQQGGRVAQDFYDDITDDLSEGDPVEMIYTNGYYGFSCICLSVDVDYLNKNITKVYESEAMKVINCLEDKNLKRVIDLSEYK